MRTFLILSMMLVASIAGAQNKLTVVVDGIEKTEGTVLVAVYDSVTFLKQEPLFAGMAKVGEKEEKGETGEAGEAGETGEMGEAVDEVTVVIENVPAGKYAIAIFHDENGNFTLDTGAFGIPIEKFGFSNNIKLKMGPPEFKECMVAVEEDTEINITLIKF